ncbi:hypothetical protein CJU89_6856 [Yarrowia sp. B02]|nr:hypothetical protein CJU89_6856 [Yarrowia sp. B02]
MTKHYLYFHKVFCDGSTKLCYGRLFSGYGVYFGENSPYNIAGASSAKTSTVAELMAIREAYRMIAYRNNNKNYEVVTDCIAAYTMVERRAPVSAFFDPLLNQIWRCEKATRGKIRIAFVKAHGNDIGNKCAHNLATVGRKRHIAWYNNNRW